MIARRHVFHIGGYDPIAPDTQLERFRKSLATFQKTWGVTASAPGVPDAGQVSASWPAHASGPNWTTDITYEMLRWDDLINEDHSRGMLSRLGAEVVIVHDGEQAVQAWQAGRFDAILLDIAMPVMDGPTALREIREIEAQHGLAPVPIIAVTANVMAHQIAGYIAAGFDSCIGKPISSVDLSLAVNALVGSAAKAKP